MCNCVHALQDTFSKERTQREHRESTERPQREHREAEEPPEEAAATDVALCPIALASAKMPLGHVEDEAEEAEGSDVALGHLEEEAKEAEDEAPDGGPWMRVSTAEVARK